jgi:hypothetical protein
METKGNKEINLSSLEAMEVSGYLAGTSPEVYN